MEEEKKTLSDMVQAPRKIDIDGQLHMLAWITADEGKALKLLGGAGTPGPMGIPAYYDGDGGVSEGMDEADATTDPTDTTDPDDDMNYTDPSYGYMTVDPETGRTDMEDASLIGFQTYNDRQPNPGGDPPKNDSTERAEVSVTDPELTQAQKDYYGKGIGSSTIDMSSPAGRAAQLLNMSSPSKSAIGGEFDEDEGTYTYPDGRVYDLKKRKFITKKSLRGLDLFTPISVE
jgi:hypothetical protein